MYLAYVDDSDNRSKQSKTKWQVMAAVMMRDRAFHNTELVMGMAAFDKLPMEKFEELQEFKASDLYGGHGVWKDLTQEARFDIIKSLLALLESQQSGSDLPLDCDMAVIYGAVDLKHLETNVYGSADPKDIGFRICAHGIEKCVSQNLEREPEQDMALLILDECDGRTKSMLQRTYRNLRKPVRLPDLGTSGTLTQLHDDVYFGDSKFSIGLQLADLCAYFITRHLDGDSEIEPFYKAIEPQIRYCVPDRKLAQKRELRGLSSDDAAPLIIPSG